MSLFSLNKPPYFSVSAEQTEKLPVCSWVCPNNIKALFRFVQLCSRVRTKYPKAGLSALPLLFIVGQRYKARQQSGNWSKHLLLWMKRLIEPLGRVIKLRSRSIHRKNLGALVEPNGEHEE